MGAACSREDNRDATHERRRKRENELNIPPRHNGGSRRVSPRAHSNPSSTPRMNVVGASGVVTVPYYVPSMGPQQLHAPQPPQPPLPPATARGYANVQVNPPIPPVPPLPPATRPPLLAGHSAIAPFQQGGSQLPSISNTPRAFGEPLQGGAHKRTGSGKVRRLRGTPSESSRTSSVYNMYNSTNLRPQIVQALGLLETEEIQQRMGIFAEERDASLAIVLMFEWLPEACSIQDKLREIIDLERMSRVSILRQERASMDAFLVWVHELIEDARLSMLVSRTLQRQHIPSPHRSIVRSPIRSASRPQHSLEYSSGPHRPLPVGPRSAAYGEYGSASALGVAARYGDGGSRRVDPYADNFSGNVAVRAESRRTPMVDTTRNDIGSPSVHFGAAYPRSSGGEQYYSTAGDPRFLCYHPPHTHDMQQRRAASEDRLRRTRQEHADITRMASQGSLMYGREEEELRNKIARQRALTGQSRELYKGVSGNIIEPTRSPVKSVPTRVAPPPPGAHGVSDVSGLNIPPSSRHFDDDEGSDSGARVPWYQPTPHRDVRPHPVGATYNKSANPNDYSYIPGSGSIDFSTHTNVGGGLNSSAYAELQDTRWREAKDASTRATRSRMSALGR